MSGLPTAPATLPNAPQQDDDNLAGASFNNGVYSTFEGELKNGTHPATIADGKYVESPNPFKAGTVRKQIAWSLTVDGQEDKGTLVYYTSTSTHEKSKFVPFCEAAGVPLPTVENPNIKKSAFIGKKVSIYVKNETSKSNPSNPPRPRIKDVLAA
jgi:hypothetical protein